MGWGQFQLKKRKERVKKVRKWSKEYKHDISGLIKKCMDELGCTRRRALEYIDVATN